MDRKRLISIVLFAGRDISVLEKCLNSILAYSPCQGFELIIAESTDSVEMDRYLRQLPSIRLISYAESRGAGERWQQAVDITVGERIVFMRDCILAVPDWLGSMGRELDSVENIAIVQPLLYKSPPHDTWQGDDVCVLDFCFMLRSDALTDAESFCSDYQTNEYAVFDLCTRLLKSGWRILNTMNCLMEFSCQPAVYFSEAQEKHDASLFDVRNGYRWGYSSGIRTDMLDMFDYKKTGLKLLEIGCAAGATLMSIRNANPTARLYGLELSEGAAAVAKNFGDVICGNFEMMERADFDGSFDYVLMGDVLEHLFDTGEALSKVYKWLKPGGSLVVSVPNVAHISIVMQLLLGMWNYEDSGILDRTHVRFFTEKTLEKLLADNGYTVRCMARKKPAIGDKGEKFCQELLQIKELQADREVLDTFQLICMAEK